MNKNGGVSL